MKTKCSNLEITIIIFHTSADWKPFLALNFASKKHAAFWGAAEVELNTKSEKGYARPGREIVQPTILPYNQTLVVQQ
jgi:hypothetical protein